MIPLGVSLIMTKPAQRWSVIAADEELKCTTPICAAGMFLVLRFEEQWQSEISKLLEIRLAKGVTDQGLSKLDRFGDLR